MYNFDKIINRRGTMSVKWDNLKNLYGRGDLLPLWVADMDFEAPPEVIRAFTQPGDKIIIQTPVYHPLFANLSYEASQNCVVLTAPSKTFNLAGLQVSNAIIPNELLRLKFRNELNKDHILSPNVFGERALIAAYNRSEGWLDALLEYLEKNRDFFIEYMERNIPKLKPVKPEGTYLIWVDCTELGMNPKQLRDFFVNKCKLALNDGQMFGEEGSLFQRFNIGCPRSILEEALHRIEIAVNNL